MNFNDRLTELRKSTGLSQGEFAKKISMRNAKYNKLETGSQKPSFDDLFIFAKEFGVSIDYLLGYTGDKGQHMDNLEKELGLSPLSIDVLKSCVSRDPNNSITMTINALLENRYVIGEISRYLYYQLKNPVRYEAVYKHIDDCSNTGKFAVWGDEEPPAPIDFAYAHNLFNNEKYEILQLFRIQEQLRNLKDEEDKKNRLMSEGDHAEDI